MEFAHVSVLLEECIENLKIKPDGIYVDGTMGGGGHSKRIAESLGDKGQLICFDQDQDAIRAATVRLQEHQKILTIFHRNFATMQESLDEIGIKQVDGILLDLGVSSWQLDNKDRGFSYMDESAPLDMRMDKRKEIKASDIVNTYSEEELARIFFEYGEEKFSRQIAAGIVKRREVSPLETTGDLVQVIRDRVPKKAQMTGGHPAKRVFQAIRIELNEELTVLRDNIDTFIDLLAPGGRLCIITFHSLEDRIVKNAMKTAENPCTCPSHFPVCVCGNKSKGKVISRKAILPTEWELTNNSRSKSAKLRVFEKTKE